MKDTARIYQDLMAEADAYEPTVTIEAIATARRIAEALGGKGAASLSIIADALEARMTETKN
jgi:hypothetical protein